MSVRDRHDIRRGEGVTGVRGVRGLEVKRADGDFPAQPKRAFLHEPPFTSK